MLLDQISKLRHAPSTQFQTMPPTTEVPEEVKLLGNMHSTPFLNLAISLTYLHFQREEDMEVRPKPRIWNGEQDYESDEDENDKPVVRSLNSEATYGTNTDLR